jgi:hypothetical protein
MKGSKMPDWPSVGPIATPLYRLSSEAKKAQDRKDDNDESDDVDNAVDGSISSEFSVQAHCCFRGFGAGAFRVTLAL